MDKPTIEQVAWVFKKIVEGEHGTYRHLIYDKMGFDVDAYEPLLAGMAITNAFCDAEAKDAAEAERDRLREALGEAAKSLDTLAHACAQTGFEDFIDIRGYANSRARVAREALLRAEKPEADGLRRMTYPEIKSALIERGIVGPGLLASIRDIYEAEEEPAPKPEGRTCEIDLQKLKSLENELLSNGTHRLFLDNFERTVGGLAIAGYLNVEPAASDGEGE